MRVFSRACARHTTFRLQTNTPRPHFFCAKPKPLLREGTVLPRRYSTPSNTTLHQSHDVAPSRLESKTHPLGWEVIQDQIDPYFSKHWDFGNEEEKRKFLALGLSRAFSQFFPLTRNDRVEAVCKMHYLAFLIDDQLEKLDLSDMLSYRNRAMQIARAKTTPNKGRRLELMLSDTVQLIKSLDEPLAGDLIEGFCALLQAQTAENRASIKHLGPYLAHRELDMGRLFYSALIRFGAAIRLSPEELKQTAALESCAFRFMGVLNDIYSWNREWKVYQTNPSEGARPFSAVYILAQETGLSYPACKRIMYSYCRELETAFKEAEQELVKQSGGTLQPDLETYVRGLEYLMSGIEQWSQWTPRYRT